MKAFKTYFQKSNESNQVLWEYTPYMITDAYEENPTDNLDHPFRSSSTYDVLIIIDNP